MIEPKFLKSFRKSLPELQKAVNIGSSFGSKFGTKVCAKTFSKCPTKGEKILQDMEKQQTDIL